MLSSDLRMMLMLTLSSLTAFTTGLIGSITQAGPFDAAITFPTGLSVAWNGESLGQISMPTVRSPILSWLVK